jgi:hypothetical protein
MSKLIPLSTPACFNLFGGIGGELVGPACQLNGGAQQNQCTQTGGVVKLVSAPGLTGPIPMCTCPQGLLFYAPSGGCVRTGTGAMPQTSQPPKKLN